MSYDTLAQKIRETCRAVVLFDGAASDVLETALGKDVSFVRASSMPAAVAEAVARAQKGDVILLSPGAASFGMFKNEFDRGEQFNREVVRVSSL